MAASGEQDSRTRAARTHFDRWSATYETGRGAGRLQMVIADANRRHPAVFVGDLALGRLQPSHVGFRSPAQLMRDLCAAGFTNASACTIWHRGYAFVRAER